MSIDIAPTYQPSDIAGWRVEHADGSPWDAEVQLVHEDAVGGLLEHNLRCEEEDCVYYNGSIAPVPALEVPSVNMAILNGHFVADALGVGEQLRANSGVTLDAQDFADRLTVASLLAERDAGRPGSETVGVTADGGAGMTIIDCGRREGYLQGILVELSAVAAFALSHGRTVQIA